METIEFRIIEAGDDMCHIISNDISIGVSTCSYDMLFAEMQRIDKDMGSHNKAAKFLIGYPEDNNSENHESKQS